MKTRLLWSALFVGFLLAAFMVVPRPCDRHEDFPSKAEADVVTLATALGSFISRYGSAPHMCMLRNDASTDVTDKLLAVLAGDGRDAVARRENPESCPFIVGDSRNRLRDPWGNPYHILHDSDGDGRIRLGDRTIIRVAVAWSSGRDGIDELGLGDDVVSW